MAETRLEAIEVLMGYPIEGKDEDSEPDYEDD